MPRTFDDYARRLQGEISSLPIDLAFLQVQDAGRDIFDAHQWSFLEAEGILYSPASITSGSFSVTKNSKSIIADATAITALTNLTFPTIIKRQIRFAGGTIYNIVNADNLLSTGELILDRIVREQTNSAISYVVFRCYFGYPEDGDGNEVTDFKSYRSVYNPVQNYAFYDLSLSREKLNAFDPQRTSQDNPVYLASYKSINNIPMWEMWPTSMSEIPFVVNYQSRWIDFTSSSILPPAIPEQLLMERSRYYAYRWAESNKGLHTNLKGTNWLQLAFMIDNGNLDRPEGSYYQLLERAKNKDREMFLDMIVATNAEIASANIGDDTRTGYFQIDYVSE